MLSLKRVMEVWFHENVMAFTPWNATYAKMLLAECKVNLKKVTTDEEAHVSQAVCVEKN